MMRFVAGLAVGVIVGAVATYALTRRKTEASGVTPPEPTKKHVSPLSDVADVFTPADKGFAEARREWQRGIDERMAKEDADYSRSRRLALPQNPEDILLEIIEDFENGS